MTEPTLKSRNEAAYLAGLDTWENAQAGSGSVAIDSIRAHALTLDELHARKEVSEAERLYEQLAKGVSKDAAIAILEKALAKDKPSADGWIDWHGGECPVAPDTRVEVKFRDGTTDDEEVAGFWFWGKGDGGGQIIAYRVL